MADGDEVVNRECGCRPGRCVYLQFNVRIWFSSPRQNVHTRKLNNGDDDDFRSGVVSLNYLRAQLPLLGVVRSFVRYIVQVITLASPCVTSALFSCFFFWSLRCLCESRITLQTSQLNTMAVVAVFFWSFSLFLHHVTPAVKIIGAGCSRGGDLGRGRESRRAGAAAGEGFFRSCFEVEGFLWNFF